MTDDYTLPPSSPAGGWCRPAAPGCCWCVSSVIQTSPAPSPSRQRAAGGAEVKSTLVTDSHSDSASFKSYNHYYAAMCVFLLHLRVREEKKEIKNCCTGLLITRQVNLKRISLRSYWSQTAWKVRAIRIENTIYPAWRALIFQQYDEKKKSSHCWSTAWKIEI